MKHISLELGLILNLYNAAIHHKKYCDNSDCNVSLLQLELAARELAKKLTNSDEVREFKEMKWVF